MFEPLRKLWLAGLGIGELTEEKLKSNCDDPVARGEVSRKEARELVSGSGKRAAQRRQKIQSQIDGEVVRRLGKLGMPRTGSMASRDSDRSPFERRAVLKSLPRDTMRTTRL